MEIVLQNSFIRIRTDFDTLNAPWMADFLTLHYKNMLFLPQAVLIFNNSANAAQKDLFFEKLSRYYARNHDFSNAFYKRSMMRYIKKPIKIELSKSEERQSVAIELYAHDAQNVTLSLYAPNRWVISYLRAQLEHFVIEVSDTSLRLDMEQMHAKSRLERTLNKRHVLHYQLQYHYDSRFMARLYGEYADFAFEDDDESQKQIESMMHYYTILECPVGATQDALKKSYKKLVRVYHPDRVHSEHPDMIYRYTQKFQLLQEAYTALRIVS